MTGPETVYLDHNATSPLLPSAREALLEVLDGPAGNPSSVHRDGAHARAILDRSRATIADLLGARPDQILFTSGGTESNNLAIFGAAQALDGGGRRADSALFFTSAIEHPSVLACFNELEAGTRIVRYVSPDTAGLVLPEQVVDAVADAIADNPGSEKAPVLVSIQLANHETGALHSVAAIGETLRDRFHDRTLFLHCDAVQGFGKVSFTAAGLSADLLSISAHKIGGPIGVGALFVREPGALRPVFFGGSQEGSLRPGTASPALAAAFAAAATERVRTLEAEVERHQQLRARLSRRLAALDVGVRIQTPDSSVANTLSFSLPGVDREALLVSLDFLGFRVSAGAACSSGAAGPSPVLLAMGRDESVARSTLRISLGPETTEPALDRFADALQQVLPRVR